MPSRAFLLASERLWKRRHTYRQQRLNHWRAQPDCAPGVLEARAKWEKLRDEASKRLHHRRRQLAALAAPPIITARELGLRFQNVFGPKGPLARGAGHYTATDRCADRDELIAEARRDHAYHTSQGGGGLAYEAMVADDGTILLGNPIDRKGAAVAYHNTGLVNICCPGTIGHRMTDAQRRSIKWLLDNWHTRRVPSAHRLPVPARRLDWRGHKEWPRNATACPDAFLPDYKELWK